MVPILILVILGLLVVLLAGAETRKLLLDACSATQVRAGERTNWNVDGSRFRVSALW